MANASYNPTIDFEVLEEILQRLKFKGGFSDIQSTETYDAKGINIDYLITLKINDDKITLNNFPITKHFDECFQNIVNILKSNQIESINILQDYVKSSELVALSESLANQLNTENFNYCLGLSDRYLPDVTIRINHKLNSLADKLAHTTWLYQTGEYKKIAENMPRYDEVKITDKLLEAEASLIYQEIITDLNKDFANYILVWLHAYRISMAIRECRNVKGIIAFSHRYKGWALPEYQLSDNFRLNFRTNFGYGYSSHFYILFNYKGIQIFPFMDWINYDYQQASHLSKYTKKIHELKESRESYISNGKRQSYVQKRIQLDNESWKFAMDYVFEAANNALLDENSFIQKYILEPAKTLVSELSLLLNDDKKYIELVKPKFENDFDLTSLDKDGVLVVKKLYLMEAKAAKISGTLDFINEFKKLNTIIDNAENYTEDIENLNKQIRPLLVESLPKYESLISNLTADVEKYRLSLAKMYQGTNGLKEIRKNPDNFSSEFKQSLEKKYREIAERKNKTEQELQHTKRLVNNIRRYIKNIDKYFSETVLA